MRVVTACLCKQPTRKAVLLNTDQWANIQVCRVHSIQGLWLSETCVVDQNFLLSWLWISMCSVLLHRQAGNVKGLLFVIFSFEESQVTTWNQPNKGGIQSKEVAKYILSVILLLIKRIQSSVNVSNYSPHSVMKHYCCEWASLQKTAWFYSLAWWIWKHCKWSLGCFIRAQ